MRNQERERGKAPLWEALLRYEREADVSFHVPGHKNGAMYKHSSSGLLRNVLKIDATEITGLDDLHHPEGVIEEAQRQAASFFGAEETFFLVGGSTSGNLGLILTACCQPGDILLVQRNVHKSVLHGLMLAHAQAVFLAPEVDGASGLAVMPSAETVGEALRRYPGAKGVLVTHPNYYGMGAPLAQLAELCHAAGVPLLVDEAHGAHYGLAAELPQSALAQGADGVVQSTHKMLGAMTMGAMLHVQGPLLDRPLLRQRLAMVQSSSPSYPIMASLDLCRSWLEQEGPAALAESLAAAQQLRRGIQQLRRFKIVQPEVHFLQDGGNSKRGSNSYPAYTAQDPFKVVLYDACQEWSGYELQERLERRKCVPEMSDERYTVLALGPGTTLDDVNHLLGVLHTLEAELGNSPDQPPEATHPLLSTWNNRIGEAVSEPVAFHLTPPAEKTTEPIALEQSAGRMAAEMVIPYPPGIPLLYPGETVSPETAARLIALREGGSRFQGAKDPSLQQIQVYSSGNSRNEDSKPEEKQ
ncbi:aminotransferase class I/II-fold pyridoxal phosphate-dependent enzyme [Paenibacillus pinistramenti]|uniref:aminotransferase class I/II-fold pyridoxal phosphate-dependent enzyme n=1 Tax=Paenibacillus pinistramenti TaxID=1768003 RepID=UPI001107BF70|nr:aminotransferase class I/II-fold pyridoxal phosphate-dependent enzyme [Paenibacillus pinistramenti]